MPRIARIRKTRNPRRRRAAASHLPKYQVVRGSARNPVAMALESSRAGADKMAKWLRHHFPGGRVRVIKYRPEGNREAR